MSDRDNERLRQRYAEDPEYRQHKRTTGKAWWAANKDRINAAHRLRWATDPKYRQYKSTTGKAWWAANKDRINAAHRLRWATDPKYRKKHMKRTWAVSLKRKYGMTVEDYDRMFKKQKGRCAICKKKSRGRRLHVDHNHRKKYVRRLLCNRCNRGLGIFEDDARLLRRTTAYLVAEAKAHREGKRPCFGHKTGRGGGGKKGPAGPKRKR